MMAEFGACEICGNKAEYWEDIGYVARRCPRCGDFEYDRSDDRSLGWRKITSPEEMVRMSPLAT
jgi:hypothetical protein